MPPSSPSDSRRQRLIAILLVIGSGACFTMIDTTAKLLTPRIGLMETTWLRYVVAFLFVFIFLNPWRVPNLLRTERPFLQGLRGLMLIGSTMLNFIALQYLQLGLTVTINFVAPLIFALLAGPFLGEWAGPRRLAAIAVGFLGVVIVTRPGLGVIHPAVLLNVAGATCYAVVLLVTRNLSARDSVETTMFYTTLFGVVVLAPFGLANWIWPSTAYDWMLIGICGFGGAMGHWLMIQAQKIAPAPVLAPFIYMQILSMTAAGYLVFGDLPDIWTFVGGGVVVASGLYLLHRERVRRVEQSPVA